MNLQQYILKVLTSFWHRIINLRHITYNISILIILVSSLALINKNHVYFFPISIYPDTSFLYFCHKIFLPFLKRNILELLHTFYDMQHIHNIFRFLNNYKCMYIYFYYRTPSVMPPYLS